MSNLYMEGNHPDGVRALCRVCGTVVVKETEEEAHDVAESHNKSRHEGEEVAGVVASDLEPLVSDDISLELQVMIAQSLDGLSHEDKRKVLGVVNE